MDNKLNYQQARRIRGTKLTDLISDQLYDQSLGTAIKKSISLKTQAKIKGIKEKFDPLNIAKALTFNSSLGPALLGKMTGRSKKDIEYFTGRMRPIHIGTASKVGPTEHMPDEKGNNVSGINEQLLKIFNFLKKSQNDEQKRRERENNFKEERDLESKKRHEELVEAIKNFKSGGKATATKEEKKSQSLFDIVSGIINDVLGGLAWLKEIKQFATMIVEVFKVLGKGTFNLFMQMLPMLGNPIVLGVLAGAAVAAGIFYLINKSSEENNKATVQGVVKSGDITAESQAIMATQEPTEENLIYKRKVRLLSERPTEKRSLLFWKDIDLQEKYLKEIEFDEKTGLTKKEKELGYNELDGYANPIRKEKKNSKIDQNDAETDKLNRQSTLIEKSTDNQTTTQTQDESEKARSDFAKQDPRLKITSGEMESPATTSTSTASPVSSGMNQSISGESGGSSTTSTASDVKPGNAESLKSAKAQIIPSSTTSKLNTLVSENVEANLPKKPNTDSQSTVNNILQQSSNPKVQVASLEEIAVHNDEPTFMRMIMGSTRFV